MNDFLGVGAYNPLFAPLQRQLQINQMNIDRTLERLSSGLRINRAADDPFGITRAKSLQSDLMSQRAAIDNTQQAASMGAIAADAAQNILEKLQRIRELTLQSMSDTSTQSEREYSQREVNQLLQDIDRVASNTQFNGRNLLDGTYGGMNQGKAASASYTENSILRYSDGSSQSFLSGSLSLSGYVRFSDKIQFLLKNTGSGVYGLDIFSANNGLLSSYSDLSQAPSSLSIPIAGSSAVLNLDRADFDLGNAALSGPLSATELDTPIGELVSSGRIDPVSYGSLDLTLGGQSYSNVIDVQSSTRISDILTSLNNLNPSNGILAAAYNSSTGAISVNFSGASTSTNSLTTQYTASPPVDTGRQTSYGNLGVPSDGPFYSDISLPSPGFSISSPPSLFPSLSSTQNTLSDSISYLGTGSNLLSLLGLNNLSDSGVISNYTIEGWYGESISTGTPGEYVNRTRVVIQDMTMSQSFTGSDTGLSLGDATTALSTLSTPKVSDGVMGSGGFQIDFGGNGIFYFNDFDPETHTINDVVQGINSFSPGSVSASYDPNTDTLNIENIPTPGITAPKVSASGLSAGTFSIDFGSNGTQNFTIDSNTTIASLVSQIDGLSGVSASYDSGTDKLLIENAVSTSYDTKLDDPGLVNGTFQIDFGDNGLLNITFDDNTTIQNIVDAINNYSGENIAYGGSVSASFDSTTGLQINNTSNATFESKVTPPSGLNLNGTLTFDFGANGPLSINLTSGTSIQDVINQIDAVNGVTASYDLNTDRITITNTTAPGSAVTDTKVDNPPLQAGSFSIDFGSNGLFTYNFDPNSTSIDGFVSAINTFGSNNASGRITASYDDVNDQLTINNNGAPIYESKINSSSLSLGGTLTADYGSNGTRSITLSNSTTIQDVVTALSTSGVSVSYDEATDTLNFSNQASGPTSTSDTKVDASLQSGTFSIDFGNSRVFNYTFDPNITLNQFQTDLNSWGNSLGITAGYDSNTDQFTISNTPTNTTTTTTTTDTKIDGSALGNGTFSIDFGSNGTLSFGNINGGDISINSFLDAINNYTGEQSGGSVSAVYDAANDRIVINNTSVDQGGAYLGTKINDNGTFRAGGTLEINFGANGTFYLSNPQDYTLDDLAAAISGHTGVTASYDYNTDTFSISNTAADAISSTSSLGATQGAKLTFQGDLGGQNTAVFSAYPEIDLGILAGQSINDIVNTINTQGDNVVFGNINGFFTADITANFAGDKLYVSAVFDSGSTPAGVSLFFQDYGGVVTDFNTLFNLPGMSTPNIAPLYMPGEELANLSSTSTVGIGSNTTTDLGTVFSTSSTTPQDNSITFIGGYSQSVADVLKLSTNNGNINTAVGGFDDTQSISSSSQIDNGNTGDALDLTTGDAGVQIKTLMTTAVTTPTTPGNNQIFFNDNNTGLQSVLKLTNTNSTGTGLQTFYGSDIDKGNLNAALNLDDAGDLNKTLATLGTEQIVTGSTTTTTNGSNQISISDGGTGLAGFLRLSSVGDTGSGLVQSSVSAGDIDQSNLNSLLDIDSNDFLNTSLYNLANQQITLSSTPAGNNQIQFTDSSGLKSLFKLSDVSSNVGGASGTYTQTTGSSSGIDQGSQGGLLDITASDVSNTALVNLVQANVQTGTGSNSITFTDGNTGLTSLFKLADGAGSVSSSADIDNGSSNSLLNIENSGADSGRSLASLATTPIVISGTAAGNNQILIGGTSNAKELFKLEDVNDTLTGGDNTTSSTEDIDRSTSTGNSLFDISSTTETLDSLVNNSIYLGGGNNAISYSGASALESLFKLNTAASTGNGTNTAQSSSDIDKSSVSSLLELTPADIVSQSIRTLTTETLLLNNANNQIVFGGSEGTDIQDFFEIADASNTITASGGSSGTATQSTESLSDIDNQSLHPLLDITAGDVSSSSLLSLVQDQSVGSGNNQIIFGGANGDAVRNFFNLSNQNDTGTGTTTSITSNATIDNGPEGDLLDIDSADVTGTSINDLLRGRITNVLGESLVIDGQTLLTVDASTTLQDIVDAIQNAPGPAANSNKDYSASFDAGSITVGITDTENLVDNGLTLGLDPGGATRVNGNELVADSAAYILSGYPQEQATFSSSQPAVFQFLDPLPPTDVSSISFGGSSNIAAVLNLSDVGTGIISAGNIEYQGLINPTADPNIFDLVGNTQQSFTASSESLGTSFANDVQAVIGVDLSSLPGDGIVAELEINAQVEADYSNNPLYFQLGRQAGNDSSFGFNSLKTEDLNLNRLNLVGSNDLQSRLRSSVGLNLVDKAIDQTLDYLNGVSVFRSIMENNLDYLSAEQENLSQQLSNVQDADIEQELSDLTRAQVNQQVGAAVLQQIYTNQTQLYSILFGIEPS